MAIDEQQLAEWDELARETIDGPWRGYGMGYVLTDAIVCPDGQRASVCSIDAAGDLALLERRGHVAIDGRRLDATEAFIAASRTAVPLSWPRCGTFVPASPS